MMKRSNKLVSVIIVVAIGLMTLFSSLITIKHDLDNDLSKSKYVVGQVVYSDIRQISRGGFKYRTFKTVYYFKLNNSKENFAIYRSSGGYSILEANIFVGDSLKVYFSPGVQDYNLDVYQVEKNKRILADYKDYEKDVSAVAGIGLLIGPILIIVSIFWYKEISLLRLLTRWIEK